ncbi:HAMP domain-containing protein, partial [bacterium]|nr:HAMP domain-containing protein [bacterium]
MPLKLRLIFVFLILATIPMTIVTLFNYQHNRDQLIKTHIEYFETITDLKKNRIVDFINNQKKSVLEIQNDFNIRKNLPILINFKNNRDNIAYIKAKNNLDSQLRPFQKINGLFDVMLIDTEGKIIYASNSVHSEKELGDLLPDPGNKSFKEGKKGVYITKIFSNPMESNNFAMLASGPIYNTLASGPLYDKDNELIGVVVLEIDLRPLYTLIKDRTGLGKTGETLIARQSNDGGALFLCPLRYDKNAALEKTILPGDNLAYPILNAVNKKQGKGISIDYRGEKVVSVWRYLPEVDWGLVTKIDTNELFSSVTTLGRFNLLISSMTFLLALIMAFFASRHIFSPLRKLHDGVQIIRGGNLSYQLGSTSNDEIGKLSRDFDQLLKSIEEKRQEITRTNKLLHKQKETIENVNRNLELKSKDLALASKYKSEFLANMSHELRTPLNSFLLLSKNLSLNKKGNLKEDQIKDLTIIHRGGQSLLTLINDIMDLSKVEAGKMTVLIESISIKSSCEAIYDIFKPLAEDKNLDFQFNFEKNVAEFISTDSQRLEQILKNFIANALKFTKSGSILLNIHRPKPTTQFLTPSLKTETSIGFSVTDTGIGIPKDKLNVIFESFRQQDGSTSRVYGGTGLGLSISRELAKLLGGEIHLESIEGKGSTFTLYLPTESNQSSHETTKNKNEVRNVIVTRSKDNKMIEAQNLNISDVKNPNEYPKNIKKDTDDDSITIPIKINHRK